MGVGRGPGGRGPGAVAPRRGPQIFDRIERPPGGMPGWRPVGASGRAEPAAEGRESTMSPAWPRHRAPDRAIRALGPVARGPGGRPARRNPTATPGGAHHDRRSAATASRECRSSAPVPGRAMRAADQGRNRHGSDQPPAGSSTSMSVAAGGVPASCWPPPNPPPAVVTRMDAPGTTASAAASAWLVQVVSASVVTSSV